MNEIKLSQDINVITAEINSYKQVAGQAIFEVGKRLKHVKENVEHGDWSDWCKSIGMSRGQATKFMTVYEDLKTNGSMSNQIGLEALYQIATLPQEEREKEHVTSKGETKTVDEMTVRELQEVKRKNKELEDSKKQAEKQAEQARQSEEIALKQLEELESKEPKTIEKEVIPDYLNEEIEQLKRNAESSRNAYKEAEKELESYRLKNVNEFDEDEAKKELEKLHWEAEKSVYTFINKVDDFIESVAKFGFMDGEIASSSDVTKKRLSESVEHLKEFTRRMETSLKGRIEI